jgi:hypothetical protein
VHKKIFKNKNAPIFIEKGAVLRQKDKLAPPLMKVKKKQRKPLNLKGFR